jgi:hypothetical protein
LALLATGCTSDDEAAGGGDAQPDPSVLFSDAIDEVAVEIDYMDGAEPYTGPVGNRGELWTLFGDNMRALFPEDAYVLEYPSVLQDMDPIGGATQESYTVDDLLGLADAYRDDPSEGSRATFYVVWIDGYFEDDEGVQEAVLGVSIGHTGVVAMFKPVIEGAAAAPFVARFGEQSTLIHELGHAIGLVDNGIPLSTDHLDEEHGAHCSNDQCVMYWALESVSSVVQFAQRVQMDGTTILFDDDCLADVEAFRNR